MTRIAYVNGCYVAHDTAAVHIEDRGFQFADSVYEVCAFDGDTFFDETGHLDRLQRSLSFIDVEMPVSKQGLSIIFREVIRKNRIRSGVVYCQVTRGRAKRDHAYPSPKPRPTIVVTAKRISLEAMDLRRKTGVAVVLLPDERWARCNIKSTGLLANVLAKQAARTNGADEAWLVDGEGNVTEGTSTNAWIVTDNGTIVTRPLDQHILGGVTRATLIDCAQSAGMTVEERKFSADEAKQAVEAFSSASTIGALPVISIDGTRITSGIPGPITTRLSELYRQSSKIGT